jgi:hypothetical protein
VWLEIPPEDSTTEEFCVKFWQAPAGWLLPRGSELQLRSSPFGDAVVPLTTLLAKLRGYALRDDADAQREHRHSGRSPGPPFPVFDRFGFAVI